MFDKNVFWYKSKLFIYKYFSSDYGTMNQCRTYKCMNVFGKETLNTENAFKIII